MSRLRKIFSPRKPAATATAKPRSFRNDGRDKLARTLGRRTLSNTNRHTTIAASTHPRSAPLPAGAKPAYLRKPLGLSAKFIATHAPSIEAMPARIHALRRSELRTLTKVFASAIGGVR